MSVYTPPPHLSPSSIGTFQTCPLKFKYSKIDGIREPATEATLMGNFVHEIFEALYALEPDRREILAAKDAARILWDQKYEELASEIIHERHHNDFRWKSWFCVENLWQLENPKKTRVDQIEFELNGDLAGVTMKGFIDRYHYDENDTIQIGDYKTGKVPSARYEDDKFTQLFIYAALLQELNLGEVSWVHLIYLKGPKMISRRVSEEDINEVTETVVTVKNEIDKRCESGIFETKTGPLCNWCYFKPNCPAFN